MTKKLLAVVFTILCAVGCGPGSTGTEVDPPARVLVHLNIQPDDSKGAKSRAIQLVDMDSHEHYTFPLSTLEGGPPVEGQPMHVLMAPDRKRIWVSVGGDLRLGLRILAVSVSWQKDGPKLKVVSTAEVLPPNTPNTGGGATQEGHGPHFGKDDSTFYFSEINNNRIRMYDTKTNKLVSTPITHAVLRSPHGFYPNKSGTKAASTQYDFDGADVGVWNIGADGVPTFDKKITLIDGAVKGAFSHTCWWLDETHFITNATQESNQGDKTAQQSVWLVDTAAGTAKAIIKAGTGSNGVLEGVSDTVIANGKLYVGEGNVKKDIAPGHLSIWNISNPASPVFVKRFSAGSGLPADFLDAHELDLSPDGKTVTIESFKSSHSIQVDTMTDEVGKVLDKSNADLSLSHGLHSGWISTQQ